MINLETGCVKNMSIFISKESKQQTTGYWFGLVIPILVGWGCSLVALGILMATHHGSVSDMTPVSYVLSAIWVMGHLVFWPAIAVWLIRKGRKPELLPRKRGALMSLKLYAIWAAYVLFNTILLLLAGE